MASWYHVRTDVFPNIPPKPPASYSFYHYSAKRSIESELRKIKIKILKERKGMKTYLAYFYFSLKSMPG